MIGSKIYDPEAEERKRKWRDREDDFLCDEGSMVLSESEEDNSDERDQNSDDDGTDDHDTKKSWIWRQLQKAYYASKLRLFHVL
jgi:hypothetical protein